MNVSNVDNSDEKNVMIVLLACTCMFFNASIVINDKRHHRIVKWLGCGLYNSLALCLSIENVVSESCNKNLFKDVSEYFCVDNFWKFLTYVLL